MSALAAIPSPSIARRWAGRARRSDVRLRWGIVLVALIVVPVILAPLVTSWGPATPDAFHTFAGLDGDGHLLGTDQFGYDIWSRVLYGGRLDLGIGALSVAISIAGGGLIGVALGYAGGWIDEIAMRVVDTVQAFPPFVLALAIAVVLQGSNWRFVPVLAAVFAPSYVRLLRGEVRSVRSASFVEAARCVGLRRSEVLWRHVVPNCLDPVVAIAPLNIGWAVITFAGLSFLGLGVNVSTAEWGAMIQGSASYALDGNWWPVLFPSLALFLVVLGLNLLSDGLGGRGTRRPASGFAALR